MNTHEIAHRGKYPGVMAKVLDCDFKIREFEPESLTFGLIPLEIIYNPLSP